MRDVLLTGGTGYIGRALSEALVRRGHRVRVLVREGSRGRVAPGALAVVGDALDAESVRVALRPGDVVVHLVGTPHPSPRKAAEFVRVDLASIRATVDAMADARAAHLVYLSVAHPAPVMHAYIEARREGERLIRTAGLGAVVLRPWYVMGPGHRWPALLLPLYAVASLVPSLRGGAIRLGLVSLAQMVRALVEAVERDVPPGTQAVLDVARIRASAASVARGVVRGVVPRL